MTKLSSSAVADSSGELGMKLSRVAPVAVLHEKLNEVVQEETSLRELLDEIGEEDNDMVEECQTELESLERRKEVIERRMMNAIVPKDEEDDGNAILEIRAGTGGDEAALFASELLDAYNKSAKGKGWKTETLNLSKTAIGGVKEASVSISGKGNNNNYNNDDFSDDDDGNTSNTGPYGFFKYESGVHRVQRVPVNDARIHTSACSVAVLPSPSDRATNQLLPTSEIRIDTMRASGAGGQHVNTTDSAVRVTHIPTGITASIQDERSQHQNKAKALRLIAARVYDLQREEEMKKRGAARNTLMGGGDRSERIRTYNYPQDRVTDHRCKVTEYGISRLLNGTSDDGLIPTFAPSLRTKAREESLEALLEEK
eukprot:CAMPEP_0194192566 /NCGR_PEP_ID=MMETSP0154-20130528/71256_1 /TAXON_ID=1049557 /ORGANISM="Thalassiothrix antarctica, Strain L6-D1" /LENGTH=369 /DNA_ID=CAMNT_0038916123 /DNA_START=182 /DNA_END=1288 /DNA_ORIENTATION=-